MNSASDTDDEEEFELLLYDIRTTNSEKYCKVCDRRCAPQMMVTIFERNHIRKDVPFDPDRRGDAWRVSNWQCLNHPLPPNISSANDYFEFIRRFSGTRKLP